ncbi:hypothetical protein [Helicobacter cinaedi]|nr:hypothetical protein [Helicobacter cinaedi]
MSPQLSQLISLNNALATASYGFLAVLQKLKLPTSACGSSENV